MSKIEERNKKYYTEDGLRALKNKMENFVNLFNNYNFPFEAQMLGFGKFKIESKEECLFRIKELSQLTGVNFEIIKTSSKTATGEITIKETIEVKNGD